MEHPPAPPSWPDHVVVGPGAVAELARLIDPAASLLVVTQRRVPRALVPATPDGQTTWLTVQGEPTISTITDLLAQIQQAPSQVLAIGGGSVIDTAKALAAFSTNRAHPATDYLEVVGIGRSLEEDPAPIIAVPTTAGAGSEMTSNAVIGLPEHRRKVSLRDPRLRPKHVLIDPELGTGVPQATKVACALDAVVQCVESYATPLATEVSDRYAFDGARLGLPAAERIIGDEAVDDGIRADMAVAAAWSGAALAQAKLGTIHGFAGVLGGVVPVAHGDLCGLFAPPVLAETIRALRAEQPEHPSLQRYAALAGLTGSALSSPAQAESLVDWFAQQVEKAGLSGQVIGALGQADRAAVVEATREASSTRGNPIELSSDALHRILSEVGSQ